MTVSIIARVAPIVVCARKRLAWVAVIAAGVTTTGVDAVGVGVDPPPPPPQAASSTAGAIALPIFSAAEAPVAPPKAIGSVGASPAPVSPTSSGDAPAPARSASSI